MKLSDAVLDTIARRGVVTPKFISNALGISLKQAQNVLHYLLKTKRVRKVCWGLYTIFTDPKVIGCKIVPSYISFLSALSLWGITTQIVGTYILATIHRVTSRKECYTRLGIRYIKIPRKAFLGYVWKKSNLDNGIYFIAEPEKAITDMIYAEQNPTHMAIDWSRLNIKKISIYSKYYPKKTRKKILRIISIAKKQL